MVFSDIDLDLVNSILCERVEKNRPTKDWGGAFIDIYTYQQGQISEETRSTYNWDKITYLNLVAQVIGGGKTLPINGMKA